MKYYTKIAGVLFAYFCDVTIRFGAFSLTPLFIFLHYCFGGKSWQERREQILRNKDNVNVISHITPPLTWMCLTLSIMVFWAKVLERFVFFENHVQVANGTMLLLGVSILPFVIWWIRNRKFIMDVKNNLRLGENNKVLYTLASIYFFSMQITAPFVVLLF